MAGGVKVKYHPLGRTGIFVSELCYSVISPAQADFTDDKMAEIIRYSLEQGINFIDIDARSQTYELIRQALEGYPHPVIIASKSEAASYPEMSAAVDEACQALRRDRIDVFHLHAPDAQSTIFTERRGALNCLTDLKASGIIQAIGISTYSVAAVRAAADIPEIDVVFPLINPFGMEIAKSNSADMLEAIEFVADAGKGIYLMPELDYARSISRSVAVAVKMLSKDDVDTAIAHMEN